MLPFTLLVVEITPAKLIMSGLNMGFCTSFMARVSNGNVETPTGDPTPCP